MSDAQNNLKRPALPILPTRVLIDIQGGYCNLKCPKCFVHGDSSDKEETKKLRGRMSLENAKLLLDEVSHAAPMIQPNLWTEPLMAKEFRQHITQMRAKGFPISFNTNGLLVDDEMAQFLLDVGINSIFFSIDATTPDVLLKTRGVEKLEEIHQAVFRMLRIRDSKTYPRVGVSFTVEDANVHQREQFIENWMRHVDVVRINDRYQTDGSVEGTDKNGDRVPCGALYHTMPIHHNGNVSICCLDGYQQAVVGNVFKDGGIEAVWHGKAFQEVRHYHETAQWSKVPFCENCDVWRAHEYQDEVKGNLLIRKSPLITYYNRIDRSENWSHEHNGIDPELKDLSKNLNSQAPA